MSSKVILDSDPGIDDAIAILYANACKSLDLIGITTVFGNADIDQTTLNALYLNERFKIKATVAKGQGKPLSFPKLPAPTMIHGVNGLGDIKLPERIDDKNLDGREACDFIIDQIKSHPDEIALVAVGPLTNIAKAIDRAPEIGKLVKQIVIMGGAFGFNGHTGNISPVAEANIYNDPHAADTVFRAPWNVTVVGLDVTLQTLFEAEDLETLRERSRTYGAFISDISGVYLDFYKQQFDHDGFSIHDASAMAYVAAPELFETKSAHVRVVTEGIARGFTIMEIGENSYLYNDWIDYRQHNICRDVANEELLEHIMTTLCA